MPELGFTQQIKYHEQVVAGAWAVLEEEGLSTEFASTSFLQPFTNRPQAGSRLASSPHRRKAQVLSGEVIRC